MFLAISSPLVLALAVLGSVLVMAGAVLVWGPRVGVARALARLSEPTRFACGLSGIGLGYHLIIWSLPDASNWLHVPRERWWLVAVVALIAVVGSLAAERMPTRHAE